MDDNGYTDFSVEIDFRSSPKGGRHTRRLGGMACKAAVLAALVVVAAATDGVDVSSLLTASVASCLSDAGYSFVLARCWRSNNAFDEDVVGNSKAVLGAGLAHFDVYLFPCYGGNHPQCTSDTAATQVKFAYNNLTNNGVKYGMMWFDIEEPNGDLGQYWSKNISDNQSFFKTMLSQAQTLGIVSGVYTNQYMWTTIMGSSFSGGASYPLWYAHYDSNPSFSDFETFGGWTSPSIKQYQGTHTVCDTGLDADWYP
eukprot:TRINITY_DN4724_c0_g1_i1.p1 TRINITY_DN4724_c0_g1~~TRINITY_DN4724_c0_g1_i1.p1  ORF type:complete len:255 (-),score=58.17 TRINITY_DN4724_c0_g1_i1:61-825(-)